MEIVKGATVNTMQVVALSLNAHNKAWDDYDSVLLDYSETECRAEMERREAEQTRQNGSFKIIERRN